MTRRVLSALVIAGIQGGMVLGLAAQAGWDRASLPRAWVMARPVAGASAAHGRYLRLQLVPEVDAGIAPRLDTINDRTFVRPVRVTLEARGGRLLAHRTTAPVLPHLLFKDDKKEGEVVLGPPADCYVPPSMGEPARLGRAAELWVEVSVPRQGPPRPLRVQERRPGGQGF